MAGSDSDASRVAAVVAAAIAAGLTVAAQATRDGLFLSVLGASALPPVMIASAAFAVVGTSALSVSLGRSTPVRIAPAVFVASGALFLVEGMAIDVWPRATAIALYLHVTGFVPIIVSAFWSVVNERFDPHSARTVMSRMAAGGALGGVAGGLIAERSVALGGLAILLPGFALASMVCALAVWRIGAPERALPHEVAGPSIGGFRVVRGRPLLRQMAGLMFLAAVVETLVEYALKAAAGSHFGDAEALIRFFAFFYTGCGVLAFGLQTALGRSLLRRFGIAAALATLPAAVAVFGLFAIGGGGLWGIVGVRGAETAMSGAFFRAGFELLYTPVPAKLKRRAKAWIDVAAGSAGEIAGGVLIFALLFGWSDLSLGWFVGLAVAGCAVELEAVRRIHRSYVGQLAERLRDGRVALRVEDALDATTVNALAGSRVRMDRETLLERVREHAAEMAQEDSAESTPADATDGSPETAGSLDVRPPEPELAERVAALLGDDEQAIARAFRAPWSSEHAGQSLRHRLAAHAIPMLGRPRVGREAEEFLGRVAPRVLGQLVDALLGPDVAAPAKPRIAGLLSHAVDVRALEGLLRAIEIGDFELRFEAARAAARWRARQHAPPLPEARIQALIARELALGEEAWLSHAERPPGSAGRDRSVLLRGGALASVSRSVEHVFTLLSLAYDRAVVASVLAGVTSDNPALHGTAREYLDSILPADLAQRLRERLPTAGDVAARGEREQHDLAEELMRTSVGVVVASGELEDSSRSRS